MRSLFKNIPFRNHFVVPVRVIKAFLQGFLNCLARNNSNVSIEKFKKHSRRMPFRRRLIRDDDEGVSVRNHLAENEFLHKNIRLR